MWHKNLNKELGFMVWYEEQQRDRRFFQQSSSRHFNWGFQRISSRETSSIDGCICPDSQPLRLGRRLSYLMIDNQIVCTVLGVLSGSSYKATLSWRSLRRVCISSKVSDCGCLSFAEGKSALEIFGTEFDHSIYSRQQSVHRIHRFNKIHPDRARSCVTRLTWFRERGQSFLPWQRILSKYLIKFKRCCSIYQDLSEHSR